MGPRKHLGKLKGHTGLSGSVKHDGAATSGSPSARGCREHAWDEGLGSPPTPCPGTSAQPSPGDQSIASHRLNKPLPKSSGGQGGGYWTLELPRMMLQDRRRGVGGGQRGLRPRPSAGWQQALGIAKLPWGGTSSPGEQSNRETQMSLQNTNVSVSLSHLGTDPQLCFTAGPSQTRKPWGSSSCPFTKADAGGDEGPPQRGARSLSPPSCWAGCSGEMGRAG